MEVQNSTQLSDPSALMSIVCWAEMCDKLSEPTTCNLSIYKLSEPTIDKLSIYKLSEQRIYKLSIYKLQEPAISLTIYKLSIYKLSEPTNTQNDEQGL